MSSDRRVGSSGEACAIASAPGKVILFGEHAVVHGVTAVAAALSDLRIVAQVVSSISNISISLPSPFVSIIA